jgi:3-hydroxybutyryl-CoA dehydrogenase
MGRGLAHVFAFAGHRVDLIDFKQRADPAIGRALLAEAGREIDASLALVAELGLIDRAGVAAARARIDLVPCDQAADRLPLAELLFEGVPETMDAKRDAFARAGPALAPGCVVASTTSTFSADQLAGFVDRPARFLNAHWLNPAYLVPLVEVSPWAGTDPSVTERVIAMLEAIGKVPVRCAPTPGFIVPRLQALMMNEAARMVEEGVATAADIDRAVLAGLGPRYAVMGVLEFVDWGGGDILHLASAYLAAELDPARFAAPPIVGRHMAEGKRGVRDGQGFFDWRTTDLEAHRRAKLARFVALLRLMDMAPPPAPS